MTDQVLQEISKLTINITKFEEAIITWHESRLTVLTEKGVHCFEFTHDLQRLEKKIDCIQSFIGHPKSSPASCLFTEDVLNKELRNIDFTEMIVDQTLWPHNSQLLFEMCSIVDFKWSPVGCINKNDSAIAILTNVGVVEIYVQNLFKWECALQISALLREECVLDHTNTPQNFEVLKATVHMLATAAMTWSPKLNSDNSCYFITAQKNGSFVLWLVDCKEGNTSARIVGSFQSGTCEIVSILWIPLNDEKFLLVCSNILGQIIVIDGVAKNDSLELFNSHALWLHKDRMIAKLLQYVQIDDNIVLICNKHRHILVLVIDSDLNNLGDHVKNINDHRITSITKSNNEIYITTVNCKVYLLNITMIDKKLEMSLTSIEHQGLSPTHELYSISYSHNKIMCAFGVVDRKVTCRIDPMKVEIILMSTKEKTDLLLDLLVYNPTKQLTGYWDVIEVLRYKSLKSKEAPCVDYIKLYELACSDIYLLKVYLILSTVCDSLKRTFKIGPDINMPENVVNMIKQEILVLHADKLIHKYHKKFVEDGRLSELETEYFLGAKKFLEYFFEKNQKNLSDVIDSNILSILDCNRPFICQCCDEEVTGFSCKNKHLNMFCALTFTPIDDDCYLICKWCNLTARKELFLENPLCLYCDVNLTIIYE